MISKRDLVNADPHPATVVSAVITAPIKAPMAPILAHPVMATTIPAMPGIIIPMPAEAAIRAIAPILAPRPDPDRHPSLGLLRAKR